MTSGPKLRIPVSEHDHAEGPADAAVVLVEYGDYECPHCGAAYPMIKRLQKTLGTDLKFVFRNFPLSEMHPHALRAAAAAEAADEQGKYWPMHDAIFEHQDRLDDRSLTQLAKGIGLDTRQLLERMQSPEVEKRINDDLMSGARSGVNGTPTFFIQGVRYDGDYTYTALLHALRAR